jgi:hypothetical protein
VARATRALPLRRSLPQPPKLFAKFCKSALAQAESRPYTCNPFRALVSDPLMLSRLRFHAGSFDEWMLAELERKNRATAKKIACTSCAFP